MHPGTIAIDLAKDVFEIAVADAHGRIVERQRLSRSQFIAYMTQQPVGRVIMKAWGTAHFWARQTTDRIYDCNRSCFHA